MISQVKYLIEDLPRRRWFGGKGRAIADVDIVDEGVLEDGPPAVVFAIVAVRYTDETSDLYHLPLVVEPDGATRDAFDDIERLRILGDLMAHGVSIKGTSGVWHFSGAGLDPLAPPGNTSIRPIGAEQSNTSVVLDEDVVVKIYRRVQPGPNPDLELNRRLTNEGFEHVPPAVGEIVYEGEVDDDEVSLDLGLAQQYVAEAQEGWPIVVRQIGILFDAVDPADAREDMVFLTEERAADILEAVDELGEATAGLHVSLSRDEGDPDFGPEDLTSEELRTLIDKTKAAWAALEHDAIGTSSHVATALVERLDGLRELEDAGAKTRMHGDFHLGQVLLGPRGWLIIDFEGEPARPLDERRAKQSPLKDVAGMLRSFSYAATAALFERSSPGDDEWRRLEPWADVWEAVARDRFVSAYLRKAHEGRWLPADRDALGLLLDYFEIDKAIYEVGYEVGHRPEWVRIPIKGIERLIDRRPSQG